MMAFDPLIGLENTINWDPRTEYALHMERQVRMKNVTKILGIFGVLASMFLLSGCDMVVLNPEGYVAQNLRNVILIATVVMLCIVIPVMAAVVIFAYRYRATNTKAEYLPNWGHSTKIEMWMWGIPIAVVAVLAVLLVIYTNKFEPSHPLDEAVAGKVEDALQIDAIAMDWKWVFIYPQYGVASINEIYAPAKKQVFLQLTSEQSVNAFWVPSLGTVLYAMPQMNAKLHLYTEHENVYKGASANYSGDGFANMYFQWHSVSNQEFDNWIAKVRASNQALNAERYEQLKNDKNNRSYHKPEYFSSVPSDFYYRVVNRCVDGSACNEQLMAKAAAQSLWGELCSVVEPDLVVQAREALSKEPAENSAH